MKVKYMYVPEKLKMNEICYKYVVLISQSLMVSFVIHSHLHLVVLERFSTKII